MSEIKLPPRIYISAAPTEMDRFLAVNRELVRRGATVIDRALSTDALVSLSAVEHADVVLCLLGHDSTDRERAFGAACLRRSRGELVRIVTSGGPPPSYSWADMVQHYKTDYDTVRCLTRDLLSVASLAYDVVEMAQAVMFTDYKYISCDVGAEAKTYLVRARELSARSLSPGDAATLPRCTLALNILHDYRTGYLDEVQYEALRAEHDSILDEVGRESFLHAACADSELPTIETIATACPFCGSETPVTISHLSDTPFRSAATCKDCGAAGPVATGGTRGATGTHANQLWRRRISRNVTATPAPR